mgnify:CR=1 FL=1
MISYQRNAFVDTNDLSLPFWDDISGTIRGYRIFTACRTVNGKIFRLEDHLDRLYKSAKSIYMMPPMDRRTLQGLLQEVVDKNLTLADGSDLLLDIIFSGGLEGATMKQSGSGAHLYVAVQKMVPPTPEAYRDGVALATYSHQRMFPGVKLLNYIGAIMAHQTVVPEKQAYDTLFLCPEDKDTILEGSTFTIFFVNASGEIVTPPLDGRILESVTRKVIFELIAPLKDFSLKEGHIRMTELDHFSECFMASTTRNILPVTRLDEHVIGNGKPGAVTLSAMDVLQAYVNNY